MRLMFVYFIAEDAGSAQDIHHYTRAAQELGHEVVLYGWPGALPSFRLRRDLRWADAVIFVFEWTTNLRYGDQLDLLRIVSQVPRERRFVIDCDGAYNDRILAGPDYNHKDEISSRHWVEVCDSLTDKVFQPTYHPLRANVRPFLFHAYDPAWERPLDFRAKDYGMTYVGHSKFRWGPMARVLRAIEPIRARFGRIALVGHGWGAMPWWVESPLRERAYFTDPDYLQRLGVEVLPPVPVEQVIATMSKAVFNPVLLRPLFDRLRLVTCRTFETPAANTIPLFAQSADSVREIYGEPATGLVLGDRPSDQIADVLRRPEHYAEIVRGIRRHLAERHSYAARLRELTQIIAS